MDERFTTLAFRTAVALVARRGGAGFLGGDAGLAADVFRRSLIGDGWPGFWLEVPLLGEPGFDLHVYYDRGKVRPGERFGKGCGFGMQALFDWYFSNETGGVGVGFAHDLRGGQVATGAYVNFNGRPLDDTRGFFAALGAEDVHEGAAALLDRLPGGWHPWYLGLFPARPNSGVRVGAFVPRERQAAYARDPQVLARDLDQAGFRAMDGAMLERLQAMAALPYRLELQLDAVGCGTGDTLGADLTLKRTSAPRVCEAFSEGGAAARACALLEEWGVADRRWKRIADAAFAKAVPLPHGEDIEIARMSCLPSFIKAKWADARPQSAKVYLQCAAAPPEGA